MDKNHTELKLLRTLSYCVFRSKTSKNLSFTWVLSNLKLSSTAPLQSRRGQTQTRKDPSSTVCGFQFMSTKVEKWRIIMRQKQARKV